MKILPISKNTYQNYNVKNQNDPTFGINYRADQNIFKNFTELQSIRRSVEKLSEDLSKMYEKIINKEKPLAYPQNKVSAKALQYIERTQSSNFDTLSRLATYYPNIQLQLKSSKRNIFGYHPRTNLVGSLNSYDSDGNLIRKFKVNDSTKFDEKLFGKITLMASKHLAIDDGAMNILNVEELIKIDDICHSRNLKLSIEKIRDIKELSASTYRVKLNSCESDGKIKSCLLNMPVLSEDLNSFIVRLNNVDDLTLEKVKLYTKHLDIDEQALNKLHSELSAKRSNHLGLSDDSHLTANFDYLDKLANLCEQLNAKLIIKKNIFSLRKNSKYKISLIKLGTTEKIQKWKSSEKSLWNDNISKVQMFIENEIFFHINSQKKRENFFSLNSIPNPYL